MLKPSQKLSYGRNFGMVLLCIKRYLTLQKVFNPLPTSLRILWSGEGDPIEDHPSPKKHKPCTVKVVNT